MGKTADPAAAKTKAEAVQEQQKAGSIEAKEKISSIVQHPLTFWAHFRRNFINFFRLAPSKNLQSADPNYNLRVHAVDPRITKSNPFSGQNLSRPVNALAFGPILVFAFAGFFLCWETVSRDAIAEFPDHNLSCNSGLFFGKVRYRIPVEPLMILMAVYGFYAVFELFKVRLARTNQN